MSDHGEGGGYKPRVAIAMRSYNDIAVIRDTLERVMSQRYPDVTLWNFDSSSSDGTLDVIREYNAPERIQQNAPKDYNPGRVLNHAVATIGETADVIVFLNSDATPESDDWLARLIAPLAEPGVGAVFGRQTARPDCRSLFRKDTERAFGDGRAAASWVHFFSMANAAARREVLVQYPFETRVQYSEDVEWSYRLRKAGLRIVYVPEAAATHSHNYTLAQSYRRQFGEGRAEAWIFRDGELNTSFLRYTVLPAGMEVLRDMVWAVRERSLDAVLHSLPLRLTQKWGRWRGLVAGKRQYG
ncbi:MAG: glycosyltransferase [Thiohalocapsa sp.]|uniref:glycosyltransferase family 2 protein n=1 Tax=Thiohalocapsa sp. TaxID=2497641 RepID=UPI0025F14E29|nr:glycosyltransferase [Thiohalocapsa sp.]MCG6942388.1 glycosyltransferase [Thiohalocapsa sp.]